MSRPASFSREELLETARAIANCDGWENLTLNHVARDLGVKPPSLYNHIQGLPGLRRDLTVHVVGEMIDEVTRAAVGISGGEAVTAIARTYRAYGLANPGVLPALAAAPKEDDEEHQRIADRFLEVGFAVMQGFGLERVEAIHALRSLRSITHGYIVLELEGGFGLPEEIEKSFEWAMARFVAGLER